MAINQLPPQAYTKDDVNKAYLWVQSQPDYVKNMATSKETLVALYLQARRSGTNSLETLTPVSSKDFKSQLQTLATELEQFGGAGTTTPKPFATPLVQPTAKPAIPQEMPYIEPKPAMPSLQQRIQEYQQPMVAPVNMPMELPEEEIVQQEQGSEFTLDARSEEIINTVKSQLNIESDHEVLRMLLVLGFEKIKNIFPNR